MERNGIFAGDDPVALAGQWLKEAEASEVNDPNAMALSTVDENGMPNVRVVLLKEIEAEAFVFYTNFKSQKGKELMTCGKAAFVLHWKSLRRQVRVRGMVEQIADEQADRYYNSRDLQSRIGAWASRQSEALASREALIEEVRKQEGKHGKNPTRPPFWGGFRIRPVEIEFWADGEHRLHDRFRWTRERLENEWKINRLNP